jgi:hypothetical protein
MEIVLVCFEKWMVDEEWQGPRRCGNTDRAYNSFSLCCGVNLTKDSELESGASEAWKDNDGIVTPWPSRETSDTSSLGFISPGCVMNCTKGRCILTSPTD